MKSFILINLIIIINTKAISVYADEKRYYFTSIKEGIYLINNPFKDSLAYITSDKVCYRPCFNQTNNSFYIYAEKNTTYQLVQKTDRVVSYNISNHTTINNKSIYKYSLENSLDLDHWFHAIVKSDEVYKDTIATGRSLKNCPIDSLVIHFYNFFNKTSFEIKVHNVSYDLILNETGEHIIKLPYPNEEEAILIELYSPEKDIGILKIDFKIIDKEISYQNYFSKYLYSQKGMLSIPIKKDYSYFTFLNGSLKKVTFPLYPNFPQISYFFVQKTDSINVIELFEITQTKDSIGDYLILAPKEFSSSIASLKGILEKSHPGLKIIVINPQEIYNKYSLSKQSPEAIKLFLHKVSPKYVLIVGDASSRDESAENLVPTFYYKQKDKIRIASDYIYCYLNDPMDAKFALGRIPVKSNLELDIYLEKLKAYLKQKNKFINLIIDDEQLLDKNTRIHKSIYYKENRNLWDKIFNNNTLVQTINKTKPTLICHIGHGSFSGWRKDNKIEFEDMEELEENINFNLVDLSCWTGDYAHRNQNSFSEKLLKLNNKGPVNIIASSGYTYLKNYKFITTYLNMNINMEVGILLNRFKSELFHNNQLDMDDVHAFNLLGIPSLRFKY